MNENQSLLPRLELLERELRRERQTRGRIAKALVAVLAVGTLVAVVQEARAWGGCNQFLSTYGLKTFCAGDPALAADINSNFQALAKDLEAKVGTVTDANVTVKSNAAVTGTTTLTGKLTATGGAAVTGVLTADGVKSGYIAPAATTWEADSGKAVDGALILNDNNLYKALMIVGRTGSDGLRKVQLYDDVTVNSTLTVNNKLTVNKTLSGTGDICIGTYDCATVTDSCASAACPAGKVAVSAVMPTSCGGSTNHSLSCCRLKLVAAKTNGTCP
jgi:hypothetical protein